MPIGQHWIIACRAMEKTSKHWARKRSGYENRISRRRCWLWLWSMPKYVLKVERHHLYHLYEPYIFWYHFSPIHRRVIAQLNRIPCSLWSIWHCCQNAFQNMLLSHSYGRWWICLHLMCALPTKHIENMEKTTQFFFFVPPLLSSRIIVIQYSIYMCFIFSQLPLRFWTVF